MFKKLGGKSDIQLVGNRILDPVEDCCNRINILVNSDIIRLYDSIENFIFQDVDYSKLSSIMPPWIIDAGVTPEIRMSKAEYEKLRQVASHPIFGRFIYYYDLWMKIAAVQDRLEAVVTFMRQFYSIVPSQAQYEEHQYTSAARCGGGRETEAHMLLNSVFVAYASVFDLISKIAVEQYEYNKYDFGRYRKMQSKDICYNKNLQNIDASLREDGMLFSEPPVVRTIETFRNEFVHNGPWDLRCCLYSTAVNGEPADVVLYGPDLEESGVLVSSGARNKFYSQGNRMNIKLPYLIKEVTLIVQKTIQQITNIYESKTIKHIDEKITQDCLKAVVEYCLAVPEKIGDMFATSVNKFHNS